jgi:hypothetical protein
MLSLKGPHFPNNLDYLPNNLASYLNYPEFKPSLLMGLILVVALVVLPDVVSAKGVHSTLFIKFLYTWEKHKWFLDVWSCEGLHNPPISHHIPRL